MQKFLFKSFRKNLDFETQLDYISKSYFYTIKVLRTWSTISAFIKGDIRDIFILYLEQT